MPRVSELAAGLRKVVTRGTASDSATAELAKAADAGSAKTADVSATPEAANVSAAETAADMSAAETAAQMSAAAETMSTTEAATVSTTETTAVPTASAAAGKRVSGQSPRERGSRCQDDHRFT
jgi:hypothetical protein